MCLALSTFQDRFVQCVDCALCAQLDCFAIEAATMWPRGGSLSRHSTFGAGRLTFFEL